MHIEQIKQLNSLTFKFVLPESYALYRISNEVRVFQIQTVASLRVLFYFENSVICKYSTAKDFI